MKRQVLADFVAEFSSRNKGEMVCHVESHPWRVFVDGASSTMGAGVGIVIVTPEGIRLEHSFRLGFRASNNEAKYEALLAGLRTVLGMRTRDVEIHLDSRLVVSQVQGIFEARDFQMREYLQVVKQVMGKFCMVKVAQGQNRHTNSLAMLASTMIEDVPRLIKVELITEASISTATDVSVAGVGVTVISTIKSCWMDPIIDFLAEDCVPDDEKEVNRVHRIASRYRLSTDRKLYRRSFRGPYLLCLHSGKLNGLLAELHDGVCGSYVEGHLLAYRAMTQGFWWPQMQ